MTDRLRELVAKWRDGHSIDKNGFHCFSTNCADELERLADVPEVAGGAAFTAEKLAKRFHQLYEYLAPSFGYKTREASAKPWSEVPENNRKLMTTVCEHILKEMEAPAAQRADAPVPTKSMLGESCKKCGHVHISIVCSICGCDISDELMRLPDAPVQAGARNLDYHADLQQDLQDEEYRITYLSACAKDSEEALRIGIREVMEALRTASPPAVAHVELSEDEVITCILDSLFPTDKLQVHIDDTKAAEKLACGPRGLTVQLNKQLAKHAGPAASDGEGLRELADELNQCLQIIVTNAGNWPIMSDKLKGSHSFRRERKEALECQKNIENAVERAKKATWAAARAALPSGEGTK